MAFGIAVVGLDHWYTALGVLDIAAASDVAPLVGVADASETRQAQMREKYPAAFVTGHWNELIARPYVALVAICTPTKDAPEIAKAALRAGKHVVSVKPPARSLAELDDVLAVAQMSGKFYGSFEGMQRLTPRITLLRELIQSGAIGLPLSYHQVGHGGLPSPWPGETGDSWWLHKENVPGGAWIDHAIYAVDMARFVFDGEITYAAGMIENRVHQTLSLEDYGASLMRLQGTVNNAPASVSVLLEDTWTSDPSSGGIHRQQIIGTHGSLRPDGNDWVITNKSGETRHAIPAAPFFRLDALAELLQTGQTPPFGPADARANLAACLAVYEAAAAK